MRALPCAAPPRAGGGSLDDLPPPGARPASPAARTGIGRNGSRLRRGIHCRAYRRCAVAGRRAAWRGREAHGGRPTAAATRPQAYHYRRQLEAHSGPAYGRSHSDPLPRNDMAPPADPTARNKQAAIRPATATVSPVPCPATKLQCTAPCRRSSTPRLPHGAEALRALRRRATRAQMGTVNPVARMHMLKCRRLVGAP